MSLPPSRRPRPRRAQQFGAGSFHARRALGILRERGIEIAMAADRAPIWPTRVVGSISHSRSYCLALVGKPDDYRAIGVDVEEDPAGDGVGENAAPPRRHTACERLFASAVRLGGVLREGGFTTRPTIGSRERSSISWTFACASILSVAATQRSL